jgi:hypothetical protein
MSPAHGPTNHFSGGSDLSASPERRTSPDMGSVAMMPGLALP